MKIWLYWSQNKNGSMWTYDLIDPLMIKLDAIIALTKMTYIIDTNVYELHLVDEQVFNNFIND